MEILNCQYLKNHKFSEQTIFHQLTLNFDYHYQSNFWNYQNVMGNLVQWSILNEKFNLNQVLKSLLQENCKIISRPANVISDIKTQTSLKRSHLGIRNVTQSILKITLEVPIEYFSQVSPFTSVYCQNFQNIPMHIFPHIDQSNT